MHGGWTLTVRLKILTAFSILLMAATLLSAPLARASGEFGGSGKFVGWWELGGFYGTDDSSRGEIVLFTPLMQSATTLFFLDARGKLFEEDVQEANLALGYRQMMPSGWNLGLWAGWDVRDTEVDNTFHQISFGVEALSERFDVRVNGYVPVTDPKGSPDLAEVFLRGNNILMVGGEEVALYGIDGEIGMLLFSRNRGGGGGLKGAPAAAKRHELRGYVGGFWFDDDDAIDEVAGPKGRLEYRINDIVSSLPGSRLTIESELSYDEVRDTKFEIGARLRIPFGTRGSDAALRTASLNAQELRMIEGLERDTDIITVQSKEENVIDNATNVAMNAVSFASNANQFANAVDKGGNRLIILQKGNQRIDVSATDGQQLQKNQTVQGGASTILMRGARTGTVAGFRAPGSRPTLFSNDINFGTGIITVADNTHVAGLNFRGVGDSNTQVSDNFGIFGAAGLNNIVIEQSDFRNIGDDAIRFQDDASNVRVWTSNFEEIGADAIEFDDRARNIEIYQVTSIGTNFEAIDFQAADNRNIVIHDVTIRNAGDSAIEFGANNRNVVIKDVNIRTVDSIGIDIESGSRNFSISDTTIVDTGNDGIDFAGNNRNITLHNVNVRRIGSDGIDFASNNRNVKIYNTDVSNTAFTGIDFSGDNTNISFMNVNVRNTGSTGIDFTSDNTNISFMDVNVRDTGSTGINFSNRNTQISFMGVDVINTNSNGFNFNGDNTVTFEDVKVRNTGSTGINFNSDNIVTFEDVNLRNIDSTGINFNSRNRVTFRNTSIDNARLTGINFNSDNRVTITDSILSNIGAGGPSDALDFTANNIIDINGTTFAGTIGDDILSVSGLGNTINGANNPNNANVNGFVCNLNAAAGAFTGSITIGNQTFVDGAGCNP